MIGAAIKAAAGLFSFLNKLMPSWEWKGGRASAERDQLMEGKDAQKRMDDVPRPGERRTSDSLRSGEF